MNFLPIYFLYSSYNLKYFYQLRFFTQNIILINRVIIFLAIFVTLGTLYLTDQFVKDLRAQEKAKMKIVQYLSLGEKKEMQIL